MQSKMEKTIYPETDDTERIIPISTKRNPGKNAQIDAESRISNHHLSKTPPFGLRFSCTFWLNINKYNFIFCSKKKIIFFDIVFHMCGVLGFWGYMPIWHFVQKRERKS